MRKAMISFLLSALMLGLSACQTVPAPDPTVTDPTVDPLLERRFRDTVLVLEEYLETGAIVGADGSNEVADLSEGQVMAILYRRFQEAAAHPEAGAYLSRFSVLQDKALTMDYRQVQKMEYEGNTAENVVEEGVGLYLYDSLGRVVTQPGYDDGLCLLQHSYDADGNLWRVLRSDRVNEDFWLENSETQYAYLDGTLERVVCRMRQTFQSVARCDPSGKIIEETYTEIGISGSYDEAGETEYEYNDAGQLTAKTLTVTQTAEEGYTFADGSATRVNTVTWKYSYNEQGLLVRVVDIQDSSGTAWETLYTYDEAGRLILEESRNPDEPPSGDENYIRYIYEKEHLVQTIEVLHNEISPTHSETRIITCTYTYGDYVVYLEGS